MCTEFTFGENSRKVVIILSSTYLSIKEAIKESIKGLIKDSIKEPSKDPSKDDAAKPDGGAKIDEPAENIINKARLAVWRQSHEFVFAGVHLEASIVREGRVEQTQ